MKNYVIILSTKFPKDHIFSSIPTYFVENFLEGFKTHTIRANYQLWLKRFEEIKKGNAKLSIRKWSGKSYRSKQIIIKELTREDGIGIQKLEIDTSCNPFLCCVDKEPVTLQNLAFNDGLSPLNFKDWFLKYDLSEPLAIIHLKEFRYHENKTH